MVPVHRLTLDSKRLRLESCTISEGEERTYNVDALTCTDEQLSSLLLGRTTAFPVGFASGGCASESVFRDPSAVQTVSYVVVIIL